MAALGAVLASWDVAAQQIQFGDRGDRITDHAGESKKSHVLLLSDAVDVTAGTPQDVELRFRVDTGYHINSHAPRDEFLLPTALLLDPMEKIKLLNEQYPAGTPFRLEISGDAQMLDVYQNEFRVRLRIVAQRGVNKLAGTLRYQACDSAACFPPRTLPVQVLVTAK